MKKTLQKGDMKMKIIDSEKVPFPPEFAFWLGYWCAVTSMTLKELDRKNLEEG